MSVTLTTTTSTTEQSNDILGAIALLLHRGFGNVTANNVDTMAVMDLIAKGEELDIATTP